MPLEHVRAPAAPMPRPIGRDDEHRMMGDARVGEQQRLLREEPPSFFLAEALFQDIVPHDRKVEALALTEVDGPRLGSREPLGIAQKQRQGSATARLQGRLLSDRTRRFHRSISGNEHAAYHAVRSLPKAR